MKQYASSQTECIPDELENRLNQIANMHRDGYKSVIGIVMQYFTLEI